MAGGFGSIGSGVVDGAVKAQGAINQNRAFNLQEDQAAEQTRLANERIQMERENAQRSQGNFETVQGEAAKRDALDRERQAKIDAQNTQKFNQDSEWDTELRRREAEQKDQAIAKNRLEHEKYTMAFQEEKTQAENRKQALQTGIGSVLSTMEMNGGVIPVSAIKIFNQQHGKEGLELTGGFMSTDGSGGAVVQFKGPDGKPVDNFIPSDKIAAIREQLFGKGSTGTRPSSSSAYAKEALGLKQESVEVRALQGTLGSISRQMEKIQIALNDPNSLLSETEKKNLIAQYEDKQNEHDHYNSQLAERVGVVPYAKKAAAGTADPAKEKVARPFEKLNGEKPAVAGVAPSVRSDGKTTTYKAGHTRVRRISDGKLGWIPTANLPADGYEEVK